MRRSYQKRRAWYGYGFIGLWLVGTVVFFLIPLVQSLLYSFQEATPGAGGMDSGWVGWEHYAYALGADPNYRQYLVSTVVETAWKTPLILLLSLFVAVLLHQRFRGRTVARAIFFLPVVIVTGPVYQILTGDLHNTGTQEAAQFSTLFSADLTGTLLEFFGISGRWDGLRTVLDTISDELFGVVWNAGIQILLFLAALQNIPESAREAAAIEGATGWEYFWKITLPYVSPMLLVCFLFTMIDTFTAPDNLVMQRIADLRKEWSYGAASAMAWIYFVVVLAAIGVVSAIAYRFVYYENDGT